MEKSAKSIFRNAFMLLFIFSSSIVTGQDSIRKLKLSLLFIGDIMGHDEQIWSAENRQTHTFDYNEVFRYIKPVISEADIAIANFEVTLAGQPYTGYPQFSSPVELALACKNAGIDYMVTANNHSADRGLPGILKTISRLDSMGIEHTGTFADSIAREKLYPLMISKNGITIALLNYTYGTNGLPVPKPAVVNMMDKSLIDKDILTAKSKNADFIVLFLHWGTEYDTIPSPDQAAFAEQFISSGVDLIIGSHPHVLQKMIWSANDSTGKDKITVYSLGNFVSNQRRSKTDGGSMVRVGLEKSSTSSDITDAGYLLTWVYTPIEKYRKKFFILPCTEFESKSDFFTNPADFAQFRRFISNSRSLLNGQNVSFKEIRVNEINISEN